MTAMTISDTERREVARMLRELHLGGGSKDLIERTLSDAIGAWRESGMSWDFITERLADLIEPSEPKVRCVAEVKVDGERLEKLAHDAAVELTGIDRDALLALADKLECDGECDGCDMSDGIWCDAQGYAARRIREALGVVE